MHELSIVASMLETVKEQMEKNGAKHLKGLKMRLGEMTALEPDSLRFCFDVSIEGIPSLQGAALEIEEVPLQGKCGSCSTEFRLEQYFQSICPKCGGEAFEYISGRELELVSMEVE